MPLPLSVTWISFRPASSTATLDFRRPGVNGVLHQFLHHRRGTLDDLPGGNLVCQVLV